MVMSPKRSFFVGQVLSPGGDWMSRQRISTRKEWDGFFSNQILKYMEFLDSKNSELIAL